MKSSGEIGGAERCSGTYVALWRAPFDVDPPAMMFVYVIERRLRVRGIERCGRAVSWLG